MTTVFLHLLHLILITLIRKKRCLVAYEVVEVSNISFDIIGLGEVEEVSVRLTVDAGAVVAVKVYLE